MNTSPSFHFSIPQPCHEDWEKMSMEERGRYCSVCKKVVRDFTNESVEEIKHSYIESDGKLCGRVLATQLAASNFTYQLSRTHSRQLLNFCFVLILVFGSTLFSFKSASAKNLIYSMKEKCLQYADTLQKNDSILTIKGKVLDQQSKEGIAFANILLSENDSIISSSVSDIEGNYAITIIRKNITDKTHLILKATSVGFITSEGINLSKYQLDSKVSNTEFNLELNMNAVILGGMTRGVLVTDSPIIDPLYPTHRTYSREQYNRIPK